MSYISATAADHVDLFARLRAFVQGAPGWRLLRYDAVNKRALFDAPGLSGEEHIHIGISLHADSASDTYALGFWMFRTYVAAFADLEQPGRSGVHYLTVWNDATPFVAIANGQRLILMCKVSTVYVAAHAGKILPYGTPSEYPQPYYVAGNASGPTTRWSSTSESTRNFFDPGESGQILRPDGQWYGVSNFVQSNGESWQSNGNFVWPFQSYIYGFDSTNIFRALRENLDGTYSLHPLVLLGKVPTFEIFGEIQGAYAVSGFNNASENIVHADGFDHYVCQNVFRTTRYYYAALRLE